MRSSPAQESAGADAWSAFRGWGEIRDPKFKFDPDNREVASFALQESADVRFRCQKAEESLAAGRFEEAFEPLQDLINLHPNTLYQIADKPMSRWVGAGEYARFLLSELPREARAKYDAYARVRVAALASRPPYDARDERVLETLGVRWAATGAGAAALARLGGLALERGAATLAMRWYARARLFLGASEAAKIGRSLSERDAAARLLSGESPGVASSRVASDREAVARLGAAFTRARPPAWPILGGDAAHARLAEFVGARPAFADRFDPPAFAAGETNPYTSLNEFSSEFPFHPVAVEDSLVCTDGLQVRCYSFFSSEPRWTFDGPELVLGDTDRYTEFSRIVESRRGTPVLARHLHLSAVVERDTVVAPLMDAVPRGRSIEFDESPIIRTIPTRGLVGLSLENGAQKWSQRRAAQSRRDFENRVSVTAPPVVVSDRVLAAGYILEGALNCYAFCLSLDDGRLLWKTPIVVGQQELTMFNKAFKEFTLQQPAEKDGVLVLVSNLGVVAGIDTISGELRWVTEYPALMIQGSSHYRRPSVRNTLFDNSPPVIKDGIVVCAPLDSEILFALDLATGKWLWGNQCGPNDTTLLGVDGDVVVTSDKESLAFRDLRSGADLGRYSFSGQKSPVPRGRAALAAGRVMQPMYDSLLDVEWARKGPTVELKKVESVNWRHDQPGNLLLYRDFAVTASQDRVTVFYEAEALLARAAARAASPDASADDVLRLADLRALRREYDKAISDFTRIATLPGLTSEQHRRVEDGLFRCHRDLAHRAEAEHDLAAFAEHLQLATEHAPDDQSFLAAADELLQARHGLSDVPGYRALLDAIDRRCPEVPYRFRDYDYGGEIAAGLFTLDRRAALAIAESKPADAVIQWQHMLARYRDHSFSGEPVARYAAARIADAILKHGPDVYAVFEREAGERRDAALRTRDAGALATVIAEFPNSRVASSTRLDLAKILLTKSEWRGVFSAASALLQSETDPALRAHALYLVAQAAEGAGDRALADLVWRRLGETGKDVAALGGEGSSYATLAQRRLAANPAPPVERFEAPPSPRVPPSLGARISTRRIDSAAWLVPIRGADLSTHEDSVLLYEPELLTLIDVAADRELWQARVDAYFTEGDPIVAESVAGRLIVRQQGHLRAFDPANGRQVADLILPQTPFFTFTGSGLLFNVLDRLDGGVELIAVEPSSLSVFWRLDLEMAGGVSDARLCGSSVLVLDHTGQLTAFDALTGAERWSRPLNEIAARPEIAAFPEFDMVVAVGTSATADWKILAFDASTGAPLWSQAPAVTNSFSFSSGSLVAAGDRLVILRGTSPAAFRTPVAIKSVLVLEPRSGRVDHDIPLEKPARAFDSGPIAVGKRIALIEMSVMNRRQPRAVEQIIAIDLDRPAQEAVRRLNVPDLTMPISEFDVLAARDGSAVGLVSAVPRRGARQMDTVLFSADLERAECVSTRISADRGVRRPQMTATPGTVVVVKDEQMLIFPAGGAR